MSDRLKNLIREILDNERKEKVISNEALKDFVPYGSDVSAGTYECVDCGYLYSNQSKKSLPPCPRLKKPPHPKRGWKILSGRGDAKDDPYPDR
ncbi:hypothetical protein [Halomonas sp. WWR20]